MSPCTFLAVIAVACLPRARPLWHHLASMAQAAPTIDEVLDAFLAEQRERLGARTLRRYEDIVELLRHSLNGYAYDTLDPPERARWEAAFEAGDEEAFCRLFGPHELVDHLGSFLGYFMVRKVIAGDDLLRAAGTVTKRLAGWLNDRGLISDDQRHDAADRGAAASRDLPAADRLGYLLHEQMQQTPRFDPEDVPEEHYVEDHLIIERVEPGEIWFEDGIGPIAVPHEASRLAQPGWGVNITLVMLQGRWHILELGFVYP